MGARADTFGQTDGTDRYDETGVHLREFGNGHENVCHTTDTQEFVLSARATLTKPATRNSKTASAHVTTGTRKSLPIPQLFKTQNKADRQKCHTSLCDDKIPTNSNTDRITFHYASPPTPVAQNTLSRYPPPSPTPSQIPATFVFSKQ